MTSRDQPQLVMSIDELVVAALLADVDPHNGACLTVLTKAGFREYQRASATYIVGDRVCDSVYLRLNLLTQP